MYKEAVARQIDRALFSNTAFTTLVKNEPNGVGTRINGRASILTIGNAANLYLHIDALQESRSLYQTLWDSSVGALSGPQEYRSPRGSQLRRGRDLHCIRRVT